MSKQSYESAYGATRKITAEARLAEIACGRIASKEGKALRRRFWEDPKWLKVFRFQQNAATALTNVYHVQAVFRAFEANPWVFSLGFAGLIPYIEVEQRKLDSIIKRSETAPPPEIGSPDEAPRAAKSGPKSLRSRLKEV